MENNCRYFWAYIFDPISFLEYFLSLENFRADTNQSKTSIKILEIDLRDRPELET